MAPTAVVLLHGLGRTARSMAPLGAFLSGAGYLVVNEPYASTSRPVAALIGVVESSIRRCRQLGAETIHFVTHSMGGILVRCYFQDHAVAEAQRLVMLAPPNGGSEIVDRWGETWWFRRCLGPAGRELGSAADALPKRLRPVPLEIGIIAGTRSLEPWFAGLLRAPNDGKVSVASAALPEMRDFLLVPHGHTFLMNAPTVRVATLRFLQTGRFAGSGCPSPSSH